MIISGVSIPAPVCGYIQTSFHYSGSHAGFQLLFRHFSMVFRPLCDSFFPGLGQGQPPDLRRAPFQEQTGALPHGGAGGHHVVHQQNAQAGQVLPGQPVHPLDVGPPGRLVLQVGLGAVVLFLLQQLPGREAQLPGRRPGQQLRLVKAPLFLPAGGIFWLRAWPPFRLPFWAAPRWQVWFWPPRPMASVKPWSFPRSGNGKSFCPGCLRLWTASGWRRSVICM